MDYEDYQDIMEEEPRAERAESLIMRIRTFLSLINVEVVIFLFNLNTMLTSTIFSLFIFWARCNQIFVEEVEHDSNFCLTINVRNGSGNFTPYGKNYSDIIDTDVAYLSTWRKVCANVPGVIVTIIIGALADQKGGIGRKVPLLLSLLGQAIWIINCLLLTIFYRSVSIYFTLLGEGLAESTGHVMVFMATSMAVVVDDARKQGAANAGKLITIRLGIAAAVGGAGKLAGIILAIPLQRFPNTNPHRFVYPFLFAIVIYMIALLYTWMRVRDTYVEESNNPIRAVEPSSTRTGILAFGMRVLTSVRDTFIQLSNILVKRRVAWLRFCVISSVIVCFVEALALDNSLFYLFVKAAPLSWSDTLATWYQIYVFSLMVIGMVLWPYLMKMTPFKSVDSLMCIIGVLFGAAYYITMALSKTTQMVFIAGISMLFMGMLQSGYRSFLPKLVSKEETARIYSAFSIMMRVAPIIAAIIFNRIYEKTVGYWPGAAFLFAAALAIVVAVIISIVHVLFIKSLPELEKQQDEEKFLNEESDFED